MSLIRLFVYGSLRRDREHHAELGARFIAVARTTAEYALRELDGYPLLTAGSQAIDGELYELDAQELARLDAFEGRNYARGAVRLANGEQAIAYLASESAHGAPSSSPSSSRWRVFL
ncbi:MAG TPA: gamma-glutamylcyclotransferase family protein [Polyangiaceae bacterium]|jgi:gamma-glutamylcyclotransferase (GGCT)/AIG2-like uncharacterized protein YtfP